MSNIRAIYELRTAECSLAITFSAFYYIFTFKLNSVFVDRARERFGVPNGLVATSEAGAGLVSEQVESGQAKIVFEGPHDVERWDVRGRRGEVSVEHFVYTPVEDESEVVEVTGSGGLDERYVILVVRRDDVTVVMDANWTFREGDRVAIVIHVPEREETLRALAARGWQIEVDEERASSFRQEVGTPAEASHE